MSANSVGGGQLISLIMLFLITSIVLFLAFKKGFFKFLYSDTKTTIVKFRDLLIIFISYLLLNFFFSFLSSNPALINFFHKILGEKAPIGFVFHFIMVNLTLFIILVYLYLRYKKQSFEIFKAKPTLTSIGYDLGFGAFSYFISFPCFVLISQIFEYLITILYPNITIPKQIVINYVVETFIYPKIFILALLSVLVIGPILEEILFRGLLQNYLKKYFSRIWAIGLSSFIFSMMHFSFDQKIANFSILSSLFVFSCFLGFVYERQRSLFASISLHMIFNTASLILAYLSTRT